MAMSMLQSFGRSVRGMPIKLPLSHHTTMHKLPPLQESLRSRLQMMDGTQSDAVQEMLDGPGKYELVAIVSHIGTNTACGHYVAHVMKGGHWCIFNDEKVALSERLPIEHGYMYLYRRIDQPWA